MEHVVTARVVAVVAVGAATARVVAVVAVGAATARVVADPR